MIRERPRGKEILGAWTNSRCRHGRSACALHGHAITVLCRACGHGLWFRLDMETDSFTMSSGSEPETAGAPFGETVSSVNAVVNNVILPGGDDPHSLDSEADAARLNELCTALLANGFTGYGAPN